MQHHQIGTHSFWTGKWPLVKDRKTLVLIHGAGQSSLIWQRQIDALSHTANTIAVDLPGHGKSTSDGRSSVNAYAAYLTEFLETVSPPRSVVACGHSMGGAIVQQLLVKEPSMFTAAMLVNTGARLRVKPEFFEQMHSDYGAAIDLIFEFGFDQPAKTDAMRERFRAICQCPSRVAHNDYKACDAFDAMSSIQHIAVPVLVIGAQNDWMTPLKYAAYLAEHIPQALLKTVPDAGHHAALEKPDCVNTIMIEFLESLSKDM